MDLSLAYNKIDQAVKSKELLLVVGNCRVKYTGRAASKLAEGDRLVIVKGDGSFLVHQNQKLAAINYQPPKGRISCELGDDFLVLRAHRRAPKELLEVVFSDVYFAQSFSMKDDRSLRVFGTEEDLADLLMKDLEVIEPGLKPAKQESHVEKGYIDIFARDSEGRCVVIEIKRRAATLKAITQLRRYVEDVEKRKSEEVRGILCAPSISKNARRMLEKYGFQFFKLNYDATTPDTRIEGLLKKQKDLKEFFPCE